MLKLVPPWHSWAQRRALGKPRSATRVHGTTGGKAAGKRRTSAKVVVRNRPLGHGEGITAHPIGIVRPATTMPASQTSQGPKRVVSSATTADWPDGSNVKAAWMS